MLAIDRVNLTLALPHLLLTLIAGYFMLVVAWWLVSIRNRQRVRTSRAYMLPALVSVAFMLRFGFSSLPQMNVIDLPYHLSGANSNGGTPGLNRPGNYAGAARVEPNVLIPKSPLFYMVLWPLGLFKGIDLGVAALFLVSLLDAAMVAVMFALVRRESLRAALWAAGFYAFMPLAFRAFAFGILPTIFAQALTLMVFWMALNVPAAGPRTRRTLWLIGWVLLLTASLVAFPTALAFNSLVLVILAFGWLWRAVAGRRVSFLLLGGLACALALSFVLYYGLYVSPLITSTLPAISGGVGLGGKDLWPGGVPDLLNWTANYLVVWFPWLLLPVSLALIWPSRGTYTKRLSILLLAWLAVLLIGMLLNLRIDMIGKHLYYTLPAAAIASGLIVSRLWSRHSSAYVRLLVALTAISTLWLALAFMAGRIPLIS